VRYRLKPLDRQVIVVTGASSGIGLITAKRAAAAGAAVVLVARDKPALARVGQEIEVSGGTAVYAVADVGDSGAMRAVAQLAVERFGRIDSWINNAGVAIYAKLSETPIDEHERLFRTNYFGVVNGSQAALPYLKQSGGALITVGSIASDLPSPLMGAYTASKHAAKGYINSLRIELVTAEVPVSVTLIKPAGIDTPIGRHAANHEAHEALIPPPVYDPELVAAAILDAAQHPRREITVGGVGRLNVLIGVHFPAALDHLARFLIPLLTDRERPPTRQNSLFAPSNGGRIRSGIQDGRRFSLYTWVARNRLAMGIAAMGLATGSALIVARRRLRRREA
jgi:short-subunit dehydrogenase